MGHQHKRQVAYLTILIYHRLTIFDHCPYLNITALTRKLDRVWADASAPFDLTPPQGFMLRVIVDRLGMLQSELSEVASVTRPTATRALNDLENKGLIERRKTGADDRETAVFPTPKAVKIGATLNGASGAAIARLKRVLGSTEFIDTVTRIRGVRSTLT